jgi:hypothetical protein
VLDSVAGHVWLLRLWLRKAPHLPLVCPGCGSEGHTKAETVEKEYPVHYMLRDEDGEYLLHDTGKAVRIKTAEIEKREAKTGRMVPFRKSYRTKPMPGDRTNPRSPRFKHEHGKHHIDQETGQPIPLPGYDPETGRGAHVHRETKAGKYQFVPKSDASKPKRGYHGEDRYTPERQAEFGNPAARFDRHPASTLDADRCWIGFEGNLKADAILSAGERCVINVAGVTLADTAVRGAEESEFEGDLTDTDLYALYELERIAPCLRDVPTIIVPDSDWLANPAVRTMALLCRDLLRHFSVPAVVAAPKPGKHLWTRPWDDVRVYKKRAADDAIAEGDHPLDFVIGEPTPGPGFERFASTYPDWRPEKGYKPRHRRTPPDRVCPPACDLRDADHL